MTVNRQGLGTPPLALGMSTTAASDQILNSLLKKIQENSPPPPLSSEELDHLVTGILPTHTEAYRSKVYLVLSAFCQIIKKSTPPSKGQSPNAATQTLVNVFAPVVVSHLGDVEENLVMAGISFLTALFQVDHEVASAIFLHDGVVDSVADSVEIFSSQGLALAVAHLLGQASGHKSCREVISSQSLQWLEAKSRQTTDTALCAAAAIALIKLVKGRSSDGANLTGTDVEPSINNDAKLGKLLKGIIIGGDRLSLTDAVEGLAYLSVDPSLKEDLSHDTILLSRLFSLVPPRNRASFRVASTINSTLLYGIVVIISNICIYRPQMSEEAAQMEKLKRLVKAGKKAGQTTQDPGSTVLDDNNHCRERARRLVASGVLDALTAIVYATDSHGVRLTAGKAFLSIVEDKENRGKVLQSGGAKVLALIIQHAMPHSDSAQSTRTHTLVGEELSAIQALAKLAITSSPIQVFGPNEGAMYDAVRPFALLLLHTSSTLLQRFEAMMALTNLASHSPDLTSRVANTDGLMDAVGLFLLEDHVLVRRAAMELICNLVAGCDESFEQYSIPSSDPKLQVVLALSDVRDLQTRLAASGTLATLTAAPTSCDVLLDLQVKRRRVLPILTCLIDPSSLSVPEETDSDYEDLGAESDLGLVHRGVICARNFFLNIRDAEARKQISTEANKVGLTKALARVIQEQSMNANVSGPAAEALKWLESSKLD